jgi:protein-S-isoprenylcysteine O-methyltransferase Ste14
MESHSHPRKPPANGTIGRSIFWGFALVAAYFLLAEQRAHVVGFLPYLLLAACPLVHLSLTIYLLLPWLSAHFPGVDFLSHDAGHLLETMAGLKIDPHVGPFHIASSILILAGFFLLSASWQVLYRAQRTHTLATTGPYARIRHPQYVAFVVIMFGFLLQWPTLITLVMFPILVAMYARLARTEERWGLGQFGDQYRRYMAQTPAFIPRVGLRNEAKV